MISEKQVIDMGKFKALRGCIAARCGDEEIEGWPDPEILVFFSPSPLLPPFLPSAFLPFLSSIKYLWSWNWASLSYSKALYWARGGCNE